MDIKARKFLLDCFRIAVSAAQPDNILEPHLPDQRTSPVTLIGAGKAAASMAAAFEKNWQGPVNGLVVTPYGHGEQCKYTKVIEAAHPVPDEMSVRASQKILDHTSALSANDTVYILLSGGGSSLLCLPAPAVEFAEKKKISRALLNSGATINEINCVRKHLSHIKGGGLAKHCAAAKIHTFAISDVLGDDPSVIASGPTVPDPTTSLDALRILNKYSIETSDSVNEWLMNPRSETLKDQIPGATYTIIGSAKMALEQVGKFAKKSDVDLIDLGELGGDAKELGQKHATFSCEQKVDKPTLIISGGETTVKVRGTGRGGRNGEYLLSLLLGLGESENIYALAADSDGIDGCEKNAGAIITPDTMRRAKALGLDLQALLKNNDSYSAFSKLDDLIVTGPTRTNINDFRAILILPKS